MFECVCGGSVGGGMALVDLGLLCDTLMCLLCVLFLQPCGKASSRVGESVCAVKVFVQCTVPVYARSHGALCVHGLDARCWIH